MKGCQYIYWHISCMEKSKKSSVIYATGADDVIPASEGTVLTAEDIDKLRNLKKSSSIVVQNPHEYGCGVDCHSKFIAVTVLVRKNNACVAFQQDFGTDWDSITLAKKWVIWILQQEPNPPVNAIEPLRYVLESTAVYHCPVVICWRGRPSVINPALAGAVVRKTDRLDSSRLALHCLDGVWKESYIPSIQINELRVLIAQENNFSRLATRSNNRINSLLVRFGITIGRNGSVTKNSQVRNTVEDLISDHPSKYVNLCPYELPKHVKDIIRCEYEQYDKNIGQAQKYKALVEAQVKSMTWQTAESELFGDKMLELLCTCPGVGVYTACLWLATIVTPRRFPNSRACSAYCGLDPSIQISAAHVTGRKMRKGNKELHDSLTRGATVLIKNKREMFGKWGFQISVQTGRWKKATNAVARKMAVALYHMMCSGLPFSYDAYNLLRETAVIDIPIDELPLLNPAFKRYIRLFKENGYETTAQLALGYYTFQLAKIRGVGKTFYANMKDFIEKQKIYKDKYDELKKGKEDE